MVAFQLYSGRSAQIINIFPTSKPLCKPDAHLIGALRGFGAKEFEGGRLAVNISALLVLTIERFVASGIWGRNTKANAG